jgi:hypothetical protein
VIVDIHLILDGSRLVDPLRARGTSFVDGYHVKAMGSGDGHFASCFLGALDGARVDTGFNLCVQLPRPFTGLRDGLGGEESAEYCGDDFLTRDLSSIAPAFLAGFQNLESKPGV